MTNKEESLANGLMSSFVLAVTVPFMNRLHGKIHAQLAGFLDDRVFEKVLGIQRLAGRRTLVGVIVQELAHHGKRIVGEPLWILGAFHHDLTESIRQNGRRLGTNLCPEGALFEARPLFHRRVAENLKDQGQLHRLVFSFEEAFTKEHFGNDAADRPQVNLARVGSGTQQKLGRTVPKGNDGGSEASSLFAIPASGQSPVGNFEFSTFVDEKVGRFEVAMENVVGVHDVHPRQQLTRPGLDVFRGEADLRGVEDARQIVFEVFKNHKDFIGE